MTSGDKESKRIIEERGLRANMLASEIASLPLNRNRMHSICSYFNNSAKNISTLLPIIKTKNQKPIILTIFRFVFKRLKKTKKIRELQVLRASVDGKKLSWHETRVIMRYVSAGNRVTYPAKHNQQ